jgi:hypothetical protein
MMAVMMVVSMGEMRGKLMVVMMGATKGEMMVDA